MNNITHRSYENFNPLKVKAFKGYLFKGKRANSPLTLKTEAAIYILNTRSLMQKIKEKERAR
jgi:hypothetical protein